MCVNKLSKVALDSAAVGIEPAISSRKPKAIITASPSHTYNIYTTNFTISRPLYFTLQVTKAELNNGVINACFMMLFKDLIRLLACYNDGIINLLGTTRNC